MAAPDVEGSNERGDSSPGDGEVQNQLVGVETAHRRRRCCVLIVAVVLCLLIIGGGASVPFVLTMINQSGFNRSTQLYTTSDPTVEPSEAPTVTSYSWSEWSPWSPCSIIPCDVDISRRERVCTMRKEVAKESRANECVVGESSEQTRNCSLSTVSFCDCAAIKSTFTDSSNGTYLINPDGRGPPFQVYCDMTTDGGGWTVFQRRQDGSEDFNRTWNEYKTGFGNLSGEFWLGNEYIHRLTYRNKTLRMDMVSYFWSYQQIYGNFSILSEYNAYRLYVGDHIGGSSGSLRWYGNAGRFSTFDRDNDGAWYRNAAARTGGGWWYQYGYDSKSPNGLFGTSKFGLINSGYSGQMIYCEMKVR